MSLTGFTKPQILYDIASGSYTLPDYFLAENVDDCPNIDKPEPVSEEEALKLTHQIIGDDDPKMISNLSVKERNKILSQMKEANISVNLIEKITGINRHLIYKA